MKIKNISNKIQIITGIPAFSAGEVREVSKENGEILLKNNNFKEQKPIKTSKKK